MRDGRGNMIDIRTVRIKDERARVESGDERGRGKRGASQS